MTALAAVLLRRAPLESLRAVELGELPVEGAEWQMTGLARGFQDDAIRESKRRLGAEPAECSHDDIGVLQRQLGMRLHHLDRRADLLG